MGHWFRMGDIMKKWCIWVLLGGLMFPFRLKGAEEVTPGVRSFSKTGYGASSQNWCVTQDTAGIIYVANSAGLLEFDGSTWVLHPSPDGNIIRAVAAAPDGNVYTSGYQELGVWRRDDQGGLNYSSLKEKAGVFLTPNVEFWNIFLDGSRILFHSFTQLLIYENGEFTSFKYDRFVNAAALVGGRLFINEMDEGIYELRDKLKVPFVTGDFFRGKAMRVMVPWDQDRFLMGTASHGLYLVEEGKVEEWATPLNELFRGKEVNRACQLPTGDLAVGTIQDGIFLVDRNGVLKWHLNSRSGMQNNTVLGLFCDREGNIWSALDRGIDFISASPASGIRLYAVEGIGAVYDASIFEGKLYLGTNQGLFEGEMAGVPGDFRLVPGTQGQVWDLEVIGDELIAGHNNGAFSLSGGEARQISGVSGGFSLRPDPHDQGTYIQCTYSNLVRYRMVEGRLVPDRVIYNFNELIRFIEFDHLGNLWAGHMHRGIYRLRFNRARDSIFVAEYYGEKSVFGKDNSLRVFNLENRMVFTTGEKLFTFDDLEEQIIPYDRMNSLLGEYATAERVIPGPDHQYWLVTPQKIGLWQIQGTNARLVKEYPAGVFGNQLIRNYENIAAVSESEALVCLESGIALLKTDEQEKALLPEEKSPEIRSVWLANRDGESFPLHTDHKGFRIPWTQNSFHLRVAFPWYGNGKLNWEWFMEGLSPHWNVNGDSPLLSFVRLMPGKYTLKVRATNQWGSRSQVLEIPLTVRQPWFWSLSARILYLLLIVTALNLFRLRVIANTRKKEQRKREESEKELISLKNEKLQTEISFKSRELANSTMAIIKKNEFLLDLRELVHAQKNQLGTRYPEKYSNELLRRIDNHLSSHDEWKIFETHFEQAHETFMKNLKTHYPQLTPGDMRLCAFLRMNLSSKEIAPLMGISVRGVENHRYRLRQKLGLDHDENLIEIILKL